MLASYQPALTFKDTHDTSVAGHIHRPEFREFWISSLKVSNFLQDFLKYGYKIPLFRYPQCSFAEQFVRKIARKSRVC